MLHNENATDFNVSARKRRVLVIEDEAINRAVLGNILEEQYEVLFAESGKEGVRLIYENKDILSLVLLDLILGDMHGLDVLRQLKSDPELERLPVIIMTSDKEAEVESLNIGAIDFIPKPYPEPKVIMARVRRTIELSEDRDIIRSTERDQLTGLYNREYFYRYAEQYDRYHKDQLMDAVVVDVNHFRTINERYGKSYGDEVLKRIAEKVKDIIRETGGIVCRREADTFLVYCPHRSDYTEILDTSSSGLSDNSKNDNRIRLRMGVYSMVDKTIDIERRFDRAKMAADTVRNNFSKAIGMYDSKLHESELFAEQLLEDFPQAIKQKQFDVYYQPKFDIRPDEPVLSSAEALVRWDHPELGMVSPGIFIPLFESNGLIRELDNYVWREVASQQKKWKKQYGISTPVSVNVSRIDMYDPDMVDNLKSLVKEFDLDSKEMLLEITESAYTQDSKQIIEVVDDLRSEGFLIEMDDFGTGYSSLNMISTLPIDALKLDMQFIRNAFQGRKDTRMLEVIIEIADSLSVPTIAEGVETAEQLFTLKAMGCDIVQGYYFSRPVPADEYEKFLRQKAERMKAEQESSASAGRTSGAAGASAVSASGEGAGTDDSGADGTFGDGSGTRKRTKEERRTSQEKFTYDALHDPVTGLYNYSGFEMFLKDLDEKHIALLIAEVDQYNLIHDSYGKEAGKKVLENVADVLRQSFRSVDLICRIGGDEFVVIMTRVNSSMRKLLFEKVEKMNRMLQQQDGDLPVISLSVGVAFGDRENPQGDILQDAETALYHMKEARICGCAVY